MNLKRYFYLTYNYAVIYIICAIFSISAICCIKAGYDVKKEFEDGTEYVTELCKKSGLKLNSDVELLYYLVDKNRIKGFEEWLLFTKEPYDLSINIPDNKIRHRFRYNDLQKVIEAKLPSKKIIGTPTDAYSGEWSYKKNCFDAYQLNTSQGSYLLINKRPDDYKCE